MGAFGVLQRIRVYNVTYQNSLRGSSSEDSGLESSKIVKLSFGDEAAGVS